jgi:TRAP-type uncharacterized transport system substrate-binding protein
MDRLELPLWLRFVVVAALVIMAGSASLFAYRWYVRPVTLSIAVGSLDGEAPKMVSALASRLAEMKSPVRLRIVETTGALASAEAFASGKTDLAVVRGDVGDLSKAQAILVLAQAVVMVIATPGSGIKEMADLKRVTVGVIGYETNRKVISVLTKAYGLDRANVIFKDVPPGDIRRAIDSKEVRVVLVVLPLTAKYLALLRGLFPQSAKAAPVLIPIDYAAAIAEEEQAYESFDIPKGTIRGAPPIPEDDVTTLKASFYLVGHKSLDADMIAGLTKALISARRDLVQEQPILAQVKAPDTDAGAYLPVHPGAAEIYNGTEQSFLDKWSNEIFLAPMTLGALISVAAAAWKFLRVGTLKPAERALDSLYTLGRRIRNAQTGQELSEIEDQIDEVLRAQRVAAEDEGSLDAATLNVAAHRLENLIHDRRLALGTPAPKAGS